MVHPGIEPRNYPFCLRLLQHDLTDHDSISIGRFSPRKTSSIQPVKIKNLLAKKFRIIGFYSHCLPYNDKLHTLYLNVKKHMQTKIAKAHHKNWRKLPGIGEYTSRSIPVFADNLDLAAIDTNIRRIIIHEFGLSEDISVPELQQIAEALLPRGQSRDWHNALMDYGSLVLTSKKTGIRPLTRQSKFLGSKRWYRGRLIKELLHSDVMCLEEIEAKYADCPWNLDEIISGLIREGLVERQESANSTASPRLKLKGPWLWAQLSFLYCLKYFWGLFCIIDHVKYIIRFVYFRSILLYNYIALKFHCRSHLAILSGECCVNE